MVLRTIRLPMIIPFNGVTGYLNCCIITRNCLQSPYCDLHDAILYCDDTEK